MENTKYAYLPEDILVQMLNKAPSTAKKLAENIECNTEQVAKAREKLGAENIIKRVCDDGELTSSIMATDGANIVEPKVAADIILSIAVGVDGLADGPSKEWPSGAKQYQHWQDAVPHHVANPRLSQGIMFLMELSILSGSDREIKILDGSHLTTIMKLNSLLSARDYEVADQSYVESLSNFLKENYDKVIPDIPNIIENAFTDSGIISLTKYSSSREIIDSRLEGMDIKADDKVFMSEILREGEYTQPMPVGQSDQRRKLWEDIHIRCNLVIDGTNNDEFNPLLADAISHFKIEGDNASDLYFCYYKPYNYTSCCCLEIKKELADDEQRLEKFLRSIKAQIISPEIREPYPQYLADIIAKNIRFGMDAVNQAIYTDPVLANQKNFDLIFSYRT